MLAFVCSIVLNVQLSHLIVRENGETDKGQLAKRKKLGEKLPKKKRSVRIMQMLAKIVIVLSWLMLGILIFSLVMTGLIFFCHKYKIPYFVVYLILPLIPVMIALLNNCLHIKYGKLLKQMTLPEYFMYWKQKLPHLMKPLVGIVIAVVIELVKPKEELFYYAGAFLCMVLCGITFISIIRYHNLLATRKLPQLEKRGGDENV